MCSFFPPRFRSSAWWTSRSHFDLVVRYSQGDIPRALAPPCAEALPYIAIFGTPEYLWPPESQPGGHFAPPPWKLPMADVRAKLLAPGNFLERNREKPRGFAAAALLRRRRRLVAALGKTRLRGRSRLLYWLRFFNVVGHRGARPGWAGLRRGKFFRKTISSASPCPRSSPSCRKRRFTPSTTTFFRRSRLASRLCCC